MTDARVLTKTLGGRWCGSYGVAPCPTHDDREPSLKIKDDARKGGGIDLHCFAGCSWKDVKIELERQGLLQIEPRRYARAAVPPQTEDDAKARTEFALRLWQQSIPLRNTLGLIYLTEHRKLDVEQLALDHALRWYAGIGAVIGLMTDPITGEPCGTHRTFINADGTKRDRKMLGRQGVIRLSPDEDVLKGLGICEGIEDGLAILLSGWSPVWCATSASAIARFPVLGGIESLTMFADSDEIGMKAAHACADKWIAAGREARLSLPKDLL